MKQIRQEENVMTLQYIDNILVIPKKQVIDLHGNGFNITINVNLNDYYPSIRCVNDLIFVQFGIQGCIYVYTNSGKLMKEIQGDFYFTNSIYNDNSLFFRGESKHGRIAYCLNLSDFSVREIVSLEWPFYYKDGIGLYIKKKWDVTEELVNAVDFETQKEKFKLYLTEYTEGIFHLCKSILIIALKNRNLIGFSAITGEKLWELEDCFNYYNLDEATGLLYGYGGERFEIIDAVKGEKVFQKQFEGSMDKYKIFVSQHMSTLYGDGLYFTSNMQQIKFGKVNIYTHEIEFVQDLMEDKERVGRANAGKPIYHNGRLYILDTMNVLHVFEDEK